MQLFPHPEVEAYFDVVDASDLDAATAVQVARAYEDGRAVLLTGVRPEFDAAFVAAIDCPGTDVLKKLKSVGVAAYHDLVVAQRAPARDPAAARNSPAGQYLRLLDEVLHGDAGRMDHLMDQVRSVNGFLQDLVAKIFPTYRLTTRSITWRLAETLNENLHVDVYNQDLPDHHVRMFVNLDDTYRIWHTSHRLDRLLHDHLAELPSELVAHGTPGRICHALNFQAFGGFERSGREGAPKHICFFEPGEVWLVDSRKVSHQIFFGRRAVSTDMQVDPASMLDPEKHYYRSVERRRSELLAGTA